MHAAMVALPADRVRAPQPMSALLQLAAVHHVVDELSDQRSNVGG
jgi:hypothetical protein